jgi:hypothetical protein
VNQLAPPITRRNLHPKALKSKMSETITGWCWEGKKAFKCCKENLMWKSNLNG